MSLPCTHDHHAKNFNISRYSNMTIHIFVNHTAVVDIPQRRFVMDVIDYLLE